MSQTVLQVRRWIVSSASSNPRSLSSLTSSNIITLNQSPRRRPVPSFPGGPCRHQPLRSSRCASSDLLKSSSLKTTDYGWLDVAASQPHLNVSRSLSDLRRQSSDLQTAPDHLAVRVREALEPIQESAEQTVEKDRTLCRIRDTTTSKSVAADRELSKENVRPRAPRSSSGCTTTLDGNKSSNVVHDARHQNRILPATSGTYLLPNASMRTTEDGDRLELGDVTSESSSRRRALIPTSCTVAADDDAVADVGVKPTDFQRGLTRRSFSLPRIRAKFSLKVSIVGCVRVY